MLRKTSAFKKFVVKYIIFSIAGVGKSGVGESIISTLCGGIEAGNRQWKLKKILFNLSRPRNYFAIKF